MAKKSLLNGTHIISRSEDLIKNPLPIIENMGGATLKQTKIILKVLEQIQERYTFYLDHKDEMQKNGQYGLFRDDEFDEDGKKHIYIPLNEFKITPNHYSELDAAAKMMSSIVAPVPEIINGDLVKMWRPILSAGIPTNATSDKRKSYLIVEIDKKVADHVFYTKKGYVEHLATLAYNCRRSYTVHLIDNMYGWFKVWPTHKVKYADLRNLLGMSSRDEKGNVVEQKYNRFKDFEKRVLQPAKQEADSIFAKGITDFSFSYEKDCESGEPEYITFTILTKHADTPDEAPSPTLSESDTAMWEDFIARAMNFIGEDIVNKYYKHGAFGLQDMSDDAVTIYIDGGNILRDTILESILRPCSNEWVSVFGERRCIFSLA